MNEQIEAIKREADDMIAALINQRNSAMNECVKLATQVAALTRKIEELQKQTTAPAPKLNGSHPVDVESSVVG